MAPRIIGGNAVTSPLRGWGIDAISDAIELDSVKIKKLGRDICLEGEVKRN
jgi:riboflavin biosynthesis pyrimidine reductase